MAETTSNRIYATGKRKTAVARVFLAPGSGNITVNKRPADDYFVALYETGVDDQVRFDAHLEVYGETAELRVQYDTPYIRHLPTTVVLDRTEGVVGFFGASSMERLPTEVAMTENMRRFKALAHA